MSGGDVEREEPGERSPVTGAERPLTIELPAEPAVTSVVRQRVGEWLDAHGWPEDERDDIVLAVHEAVANVVDHAYREGASGPVRVTGLVRRWSAGRRGQAVVTVRDEGRWKPVPSEAGYRGHGLAVMDGMMTGVRITTDAGGDLGQPRGPARPSPGAHAIAAAQRRCDDQRARPLRRAHRSSVDRAPTADQRHAAALGAPVLPGGGGAAADRAHLRASADQLGRRRRVERSDEPQASTAVMSRR